MGESLEIQVVLDSGVPVYRQIADGVRAYCVSGRLAVGRKLPSVRELAGELGVHHNTVAQAYRTLEAEGWLHIAGRKGVLVQDREKPAMPEVAQAASEGSRLRHLVAELQAKGFSNEWIGEWVGREVMAVLEMAR
jgi:DNA-binding transcriptional regulator YhcF (GntR family)